MDLLLVVTGIALLVFLIDVLSRRISERLAEKSADFLQDASRPPLIRGGFIFSLLGILALTWFLFYGFMLWPPTWVERRSQRKEVARRVESAGGFSNLVHDCSIFMSTNLNPPSVFFPRYQTNMIFPLAILALKPREVHCERWEGLNAVRLQLFGMHRTGGKDTPFYGLVVVVAKPEGNVTELLRSRFHERSKVRLLSDSVFEVY